MEQGKAPAGRIRFGAFEADLRAGELRKKGAKLKLQEQPFQILRVLLANPGEVVTREELRARIWPIDTFVDFDHGLYTAITKLREALRDSSEKPRFIETLSRRGYRFIARVERVPASSNPPTSIAILPFVFLSDVDEPRSLSLGFADALITVLGNLPDVAVLPTSAVLNYPGGTDPGGVCRDLGVRHILQGHIQKLGEQWRVSIQLFDAVVQKIVFSDKYDFTTENTFEIQDEIGRRLVESLHNQFPFAVRKSRDRYSSNPQAYDEFISGLRESYSDRPESAKSAIEHLSRAVAYDPAFALSHATLSYVCMNLHFTFDAHRTWLERAEHHGKRALALDPDLPEGHFARAYSLWSPAKNFQHAEAIEALEKVLTLQPNLERAHNRLGTILLHIGRLKEAHAAYEQGQRSNPKNLLSHNINFVHLYSGDFARAQEGADAWLQESPGNKYALWFRPQPALLTGDLDLADQRLAEAVSQLADEPLVVSLQGLLHARRHQTDLARQCARRALDFPRSFGHTHHTYYQIACVYAVLGETQKAMAWLESSVDTGFTCWPFFRLDPHLESLHQKPEFKRLVAGLEHEFSALKIERL
ncbi:MAG: winged helix-turn-helix domain-containing protein [Acidobacteriia bacterium]|nr:winged helix-turn-helix domain-containing protein [Terriglobia bacterium]